MTEYRLRSKTVTSDYKNSIDIPDNALHVEVEYEEPVGMGKPSTKATIRFLEPINKDTRGNGSTPDLDDAVDGLADALAYADLTRDDNLGDDILEIAQELIATEVNVS